MEILRRTWHKDVECKSCGALLRLTEKDIFKVGYTECLGRAGKRFIRKGIYFKCVVCDYRVDFSKEEEKTLPYQIEEKANKHEI